MLPTGLIRIAKCCLLIVATLSLAQASHGEEQTFVLQPGWNLINFQVLPADRGVASVFGGMVPSGGGSPLYLSETPGASKLKAVFTATRTGAAGVDGPKLEWSQFQVADSPSTPSLDETVINEVTGAALQSIEFGRGYFIFLSGISQNTSYTIVGEAAPADTKIEIEKDWNLVGIPANIPEDDSGDTTLPESLNILGVFRAADLSSIKLLARWEAKTAQYRFYYPNDPQGSSFQTLDPNLGHWILATQELSLQPELIIQAPGDADLPPLTNPPAVSGQAWVPGPEDIDYGLPFASPVFNDQSSQDVIVLEKGQSSVKIPSYNKGGGVLGWKATLMPYGGAPQPGSISLATETDVDAVLSLAQSRGITTSETDVLEVVADRTKLAPGSYLAALNIFANTGQSKTFTVVVKVGGLDGEWHGTAQIETVNGRRNAIADIDLVVQLFQDTKPGSRQLRGIIDNQETLLWPLDAQLLGHIIDTPPSGSIDQNYASRFVISGGYTLPPGDINRFPYETFPDDPTGSGVSVAMDEDTGLKYLTDSEGDRFYYQLAGRVQGLVDGAPPSFTVGSAAPEFTNPLSQFISREVELTGALTGSEGGAAVAEGEYVEVITGMTPEPIELRGSFRLVRKSYSPLQRRPFKYFDLGNQALSVAPIPSGGLSTAAGVQQVRPIQVPDSVLIKRILVAVSQDAPDTKHSITLESPGGRVITLHSREGVGAVTGVVFDSGELPIDPLTLLDGPELKGASPPPLPSAGNPLDILRYENALRESLASYVVRRPRESLDALQDENSKGTWTLRWTNNDTTSRKFNGWSLIICGVPEFTLAGDVVIEGDTASNRFQDVDLEVFGLNADLDEALLNFDRDNGHFTMESLPGIRVNIIGKKPGYPTATIDGLDSFDHPRGFTDGLSGILPTDAPYAQNLTITLRQREGDGLPKVNAFPRYFNVPEVAGSVTVTGLSLAVIGSVDVSEGEIYWEPQWDGHEPPPVEFPAIPPGRSVKIDLSIPAAAFSEENNYTVAYRPRVFLGSPEEFVAFADWVVITQSNAPSRGPNPSSYQTARLSAGQTLLGFGAEAPVNLPDPTGGVARSAEKTDAAKVDVDRPPLINPQSNPNLEFDADGADGEDTNLFPRSFTFFPQEGGRAAYATINDTDDGRFEPLPGAYNDVEAGISGLDSKTPGQPVRIFTSIGGQLVNTTASGTNGVIRVSAGANPGNSPAAQE